MGDDQSSEPFPKGLLVELSRPLASDEESKIRTFMKVRGVDHETAMKFLMGRKMDVDRAHLLLNNYQATVRARHFDNVTITDVVKELQTQKMYIPGSTDRNKAHLLVIDATKHDPSAFTHDDTMRLAFFMGQKATERPGCWEHGLTLIINMQDYTWAQFDLALQRQILALFTDNIPARVKNILLYDPPWWVSALVRMVSPFLKQKMRDRLQICDKDRIRNFIDPAKLPMQFGGQLQYDHEAFIQRCIEGVGKELFRQRLHLDEQGVEMTVVPVEKLVSVLPPAMLTKKVDLSPKQQDELHEQRAQTISLISARIEALKEGRKINRVGQDQALLSRLIAHRASRLSLDVAQLSMPSGDLSETSKRLRRSLGDSPLAEVPGEDYEPGALKKRIRKSLEASIEAQTGEPLPTIEVPSDDENVIKKEEVKPVDEELDQEQANDDLERRRRRGRAETDESGTRRRGRNVAAITEPIAIEPVEAKETVPDEPRVVQSEPIEQPAPVAQSNPVEKEGPAAAAVPAAIPEPKAPAASIAETVPMPLPAIVISSPEAVKLSLASLAASEKSSEDLIPVHIRSPVPIKSAAEEKAPPSSPVPAAAGLPPRRRRRPTSDDEKKDKDESVTVASEETIHRLMAEIEEVEAPLVPATRRRPVRRKEAPPVPEGDIEPIKESAADISSSAAEADDIFPAINPAPALGNRESVSSLRPVSVAASNRDSAMTVRVVSQVLTDAVNRASVASMQAVPAPPVEEPSPEIRAALDEGMVASLAGKRRGRRRGGDDPAVSSRRNVHIG